MFFASATEFGCAGDDVALPVSLLAIAWSAGVGSLESKPVDLHHAVSPVLGQQKATKPLCLAVADMPEHATHFADAELDLEVDLENVLERELEEADVREFAAAHVREGQQQVDALLRTCVRMDDLPDGD